MSDSADKRHAVILLGAGPGDPHLLTFAGFKALEQADVVLHDRLVAPALLKFAKDAELINVGKSPDGPSMPQEQINQQMIDLARRGRQVVRLKGGDPFVFGRGGEEASALAAAGISMQLIPGISSATAAAAAFGIPLTDRRAASALTVVTGSEADDGAPPIDWDAVARVGGTIVVMMGWRNLDRIVSRLIEAGLSPQTPSAAIEQAWTSSQRVVFAPLSELRAQAADMQPPVTVVIGAVTTLAAPEVSWSIMGRRILVTRAAAQSESLVKRLRALNADIVELPAIAINPIESEPINAAIQRLAEGRYDIVALTSVNGVDRLWNAMQRHGLDSRALARTRVAAIGSETARALEARGIRADIVPDSFTSAALAAALTQDDLRRRRILLARAAQAGRLLSDQLRGAGAEVDDVAFYQIVTPDADPAALAELQRGVDVVTLTSPSTAQGLLEIAAGLVKLDSWDTVCIGPVTAEAARRLGFRVVATAETHTIEGLAQAVARHIASLGPPLDPELESA